MACVMACAMLGQVLSVRRFSTEEQALAEANDSTYGLGLCLNLLILHSTPFPLHCSILRRTPPPSPTSC